MVLIIAIEGINGDNYSETPTAHIMFWKEGGNKEKEEKYIPKKVK